MLLLVSCGRQPEAAYQLTFTEKSKTPLKEYVVGVHPLHSPKHLMETYGPILDDANLRIPDVHFRLEAARNYEEFDNKLYAGYYDFAMPNPYQTVRSFRHGYRVFAKMGDDEEFRGIILVRKGGAIDGVTDLKGKTVAYPAKTALAATMMPQYYLQTHGLDVNFDVESHYVGSQESAILNVLRGHAAAAATWPVPWKAFSAEHPDMARLLEVKWQTAPLINNSWVVRRDVPQTIVDKFKSQLLSLNHTAEGRKMLARLHISTFESATDENYLPVISFLQVYSSSVREIEW